MSLPRERRIRRTADFAAVRERGRSWGGRYLVLCTLPREGPALAGFTVSKRVGNAVVRNRVRRRLREIAREFLPAVTAPHWIVTIARHTAPGAEFSALRDEWHRLARRAGLVPDHRLPRAAAAES